MMRVDFIRPRHRPVSLTARHWTQIVTIEFLIKTSLSLVSINDRTLLVHLSKSLFTITPPHVVTQNSSRSQKMHNSSPSNRFPWLNWHETELKPQLGHHKHNQKSNNHQPRDPRIHQHPTPPAPPFRQFSQSPDSLLRSFHTLLIFI